MFSVSLGERTIGLVEMRVASNPFVDWLWERMRERLGPDVGQNDIAKAMHVSQSVLSSWLNGNSLPARKSEYRIAQYLGIPLADIHALIVASESQVDTDISAEEWAEFVVEWLSERGITEPGLLATIRKDIITHRREQAVPPLAKSDSMEAQQPEGR
jgi:transcriptional regulator with XRE-family HTH domain